MRKLIAGMLGLAAGQQPNRDTLERVSHVLAIYRAIHTLLPSNERADSWIRSSNAALPFSGRAPIDLNVEGQLVAVRAYLASQLEPPFI